VWGYRQTLVVRTGRSRVLRSPRGPILRMAILFLFMYSYYPKDLRALKAVESRSVSAGFHP
ncbi:MAG: hypothetical protein AAF828_06880, partial [Bacteroidota bacterium]